MKKILLLCSMIIFGILESKAQVYFSQDFNSSTDYHDYIGDGENKFITIDANGTTTVSTETNKLRYVKTYASPGLHRGGYTSNQFEAASFMKYSMEIAVSNNTEEIPSGFIFYVGAGFPTAIAQPGNPSVHSRVVVNPTTNPGEFVLIIGNQTSEPFTGTVKLVWYINNTGEPVGYDAPDGSVRAVKNDFSDLWVVTPEAQKLAIDEGDAVTNGRPLKQLKFANNPSFTATIDIDDIEVSEEPVVIIPEIVSAAAVPQITVPMRTSFTYIPFPKEVEVTYNTGTKAMARVEWSPNPGKYNGFISGQYQVKGSIIPNRGTINPNGVVLETSVVVKPDIKIVNAFTPDGDGKNDTWVVSELKHYKKVSIEVFDRDGVRLFHTTNPLEGWNGKSQQGKVLKGSYFYVIRVPEISMEKRGVVTIIKE